MIIDPKLESPETLYRILIGSVLPRPIAWVSTVNKEGLPNLAPFSFFTVASANPPVLCFSPAYKATGELAGNGIEVVPKDTLRNVHDTKEFVVNIVSRRLAERMVQSSGDYPANVNEFEVAGLTAAPSQMVRAPRVDEALINMECKLDQIIEFGHQPGGGNLVLGRIVCIHLHESVYKGGHVDLDVLDPIGRLSGNLYCATTEKFELVRPKIGK